MNITEKQLISAIAAWLWADGLTPDTYSRTTAFQMLLWLRMPRLIYAFLLYNHDAIRQDLANFAQAEHN